MGTAVDEQPLPTKGRILVFTLRGRKLTLLSAYPVPGGVLGLCQFRDMLVVIVTHTVTLSQIKLRVRMNGIVDAAELKQIASHKSEKSTLATCVDASDKVISVGDLMTSISVYSLGNENTLEETAFHPYQFWTSALHVVDNDNILVAVENELYSYQLVPNQKIIEPKDAIHIGQRINKFGRGSLVMQQVKTKYAQQAELASQLPKTSQLLSIMPSEIPTIIYATGCGAIGIVGLIPEQTFKYLEALKEAMINNLSYLGDMNYTELKNGSVGRGKARSFSGKQFIDGDLVETFLTLEKRVAEEIYTAIHYRQKPTLKDTFILLRQLSLLH